MATMPDIETFVQALFEIPILGVHLTKENLTEVIEVAKVELIPWITVFEKSIEFPMTCKIIYYIG